MTDFYTATEMAYKNGVAEGKRTARPEGRWMPIMDNDEITGAYCSECKNSNCRAENYAYTVKRRFLNKYCPDCGALMLNGD